MTYTTWSLASMADCASPDHHDGIGFDYPTDPPAPSPGAHFLRRVADGVAEAIEYGADPDEVPYDVADACVPIYTSEVWATFVDLGAYMEDPTELGPISDMGDAATVCLYMIGERLASAILADIDENAEVEA